jgi:hypothetical protein
MLAGFFYVNSKGNKMQKTVTVTTLNPQLVKLVKELYSLNLTIEHEKCARASDRPWVMPKLPTIVSIRKCLGSSLREANHLYGVVIGDLSFDTTLMDSEE